MKTFRDFITEASSSFVSGTYDKHGDHVGHHGRHAGKKWKTPLRKDGGHFPTTRMLQKHNPHLNDDDAKSITGRMREWGAGKGGNDDTYRYKH